MPAAGQRASLGGPKRERLATVRRVSDERAYLYELIQTIGAGPDLPAILRGVVRLVTEATACHACFIYFVDDDALILRAASSIYAHLEGKVTIPTGEGLTGWVAKARRSAFIQENALEDPRVRRAYFPELGDEVYQSLVSVPIFARSGEVIGVITLHADAPHEFARADLDFLEHTASLIAGAVENARLYEEATARVGLLTNLSRLSQKIASAGSVPEVASVVTRGTRDLLRAHRCEIYLLDPDERLRLRAASPSRTDAPALDTRTLWLDVMESGRADARPEDARRLADVLWGERIEGRPLFAPLAAGDDRLGLLAVLAPADVDDAEATLTAVASHTAVAIKQHQAIEWLTEKNLVKDFFQALARADSAPEDLHALAGRLGCDLDVPNLILHVVPLTGAPPPSRGRRSRAAEGREPRRLPWRTVANQVESRLAARFPGMLVDHLERSIRALIPIGELPAEEALDTVRGMEWVGPGEEAMPLSVGVSNPCQGAASFARGFEEAASGAEVGALIRGGPGVTTYDDLGPYKYVLSSEEGTRDRHQQRLEHLVEYDGRRGTQLLDTLEGYLDHRGNVVGTSRALYIHPNTLRQRLGRIERVSGIDLEHDDWLSLAVATKVVKLRKMRRSAGEEGGNDG